MKKILNGYAGLGGNRTLWEGFQVDAVEINPDVARIYQKRFPNDNVIIGDVFDFIRDKNNDLEEYYLIWASPPCASHSHMQYFNPSKIQRSPIPDMTSIYGLKVWLERYYQGNYVIENVQPSYKIPPFWKPAVRIDRHCFWSNFPIKKTSFIKNHPNKHGKIGGIMRDQWTRQDNNKTISKLIEIHELTEIMDEIMALPVKDHFKRTVIRNCVNPKIGKYILDQLINKPTLLNYF